MPKPTRRRRHRSREEIAAILTTFDRSGQSAVAFAQTHSLALSTFRLWQSRRDKPPRPHGTTALVPVTITGSDLASPAMIEVALTNGRVLRFALGSRTVDLAAIADALERPCSR